MSARDEFNAAIGDRILIKDGPYGTMIQSYRLDEKDYRGDLPVTRDQKGNNDLLNLTRPDIIREIAGKYIGAGSEILATNTFNANTISQADYACEHLVGDINREGARLLKGVIDAAQAKDGRRRFLVGALGPTNKTLSLSPNVNDPGFREVDYDQVKGVYREQIDALVEGGAEIVLIETVFDTLNAKAAAHAAMEAGDALGRDLPIMMSMTLTDLSGRNLSGHTVEAFWHSIRHVKPLTIGLNCSFGATELRPYVQVLSAIADCPIMVYPNAGLPNELGQYDEAAETTGRLVGEWIDTGFINAVGGCCGTTPAHIAAMAAAVKDKPPRAVPHVAPAMRLSGLEAFTLAA